MAEDLISSIIDEPAIDKQLADLDKKLADLALTLKNFPKATLFSDATNAKQLVQANNELSGSIENLRTKTIALNQVQSSNQNIKNLNDYKAALASNSAAQKKLQSDVEGGIISADEYRAELTKLTESQFKYKLAIAETSKEIKTQTALNAADPSKIRGLEKINTALGQQRDTQVPIGATASTEDIAKIKAINAEIDKNNELIRINKDLLSQQKINIGNYPTSFGPAFKTLNAELEAVQGKLVSGNFKGKELDELTARLNVLKSVTTNTGKEFSSTAAAQNAFKEAGIQLASVYGKDSEVVKTFATQVNTGNKEVNASKDAFAKAGGEAGKFGGVFTKIFSGFRQLANIIPGLGLSGLLLLLITPLASLGAAIFDTGKKATGLGNNFQDLAKRTKDIEKDIHESAKAFEDAVKNVNELTINIDLAKKGFLNKDQVLKQYNDTIGKTTGQVKSLDQAEQALVKNGDAYIQMMLLKAAAQIALGEAAKKAFEAEEIRRKKETEFANTFVDTRIATPGAFNAADYDADTKRISDARKKRQAQAVKSEKDASDEQLSIFRDLQKQAAEIAKSFGYDFFGGKEDPKKKVVDNLQALVQLLNKDFEQYQRSQLRKIKLFEQGANDENSNYADRLAALKNFIDGEKQLQDRSRANEIQDATAKARADIQKLNEDKAGKSIKEQERINENIVRVQKNLNTTLKDINSKYKDQSLTIDDDQAKRSIEITRHEYDVKQKIAEEHYKFIVDQSKIAFQNLKDEVDISKDERLLQLEEDLRNGDIKSSEEYNRRKDAIETKALIDQEKLDLKRLQDAEIVFESLYGFRNPALIKAAKDLEVKINEDGNKKILENDQELVDKRKELIGDLENLLQGVIEGGFDARQAKNEAELKAIDERSQKEIDAVNASTLAQEEKTKRITAIEKQAAFQRLQIEQRQRQQDIQRAVFERAASIARVIQYTAEAVSRDLLGEKKFLIPFDIAIGAAQIALILAQPLPKFKKGTKNAPKGPAIVGEEGSELIERNGKMFITPPRPTLIDLAGGEQIFAHNVTKDLLNQNNMIHILTKMQNKKEVSRIEERFDKNIYGELKKLNSKPPFIIQVQQGFETTDRFYKNFKN